MNTQVTQKKRLTIRSAKASAEPVDAEAGAEGVGGADAPVIAARGTDSNYHRPAAILAIVASLVVAVLIAVQLMEWAFYKAPPTVWTPRILAPGTVR